MTLTFSGLIVAIIIAVALTFYRGFRYKVEELGVDSDAPDNFKPLSSDGDVRRQDNTLILRLSGIMSFVNFETVMKKLHKLVNAVDKDQKRVKDKTAVCQLMQV